MLSVRVLLTINLAFIDRVRDGLRALAINLAADAEGGSQHFLDRTLQRLGEGLITHCPCNLDDLVQGNRLAVLDIFLLLAIPRRLLQGADDEGRCGGDDRDSCLPVLNGQAAPW